MAFDAQFRMDCIITISRAGSAIILCSCADEHSDSRHTVSHFHEQVNSRHTVSRFHFFSKSSKLNSRFSSSFDGKYGMYLAAKVC